MRDTTLRDGSAKVRAGTREKVERATAVLDYRPNVLARNLANGRSGQIAVVVPYLDTPYFAELLQAMIPAARRAGYNVLIDQTDGDREHEGQLIGRGSRGFLFD